MNPEQENIPDQPESQDPKHVDEQQRVDEQQHETPGKSISKKAILFTLNLVIAALLVLTGYLSHKFLDRYFLKVVPATVQQQEPQQQTQPAGPKSEQQKLAKVVQVDIQNGSGEKGVASRFTNFLRARGYDVVEAKNYKVSNVPHTLIVDRLGNLQIARDLAEHVGVADTNIIQQLNPDYFVDVSIVIGQDCYQLFPSKESK